MTFESFDTLLHIADFMIPESLFWVRRAITHSVF